MDSALPRDPLMPRRPKGMGAGLGLAILAHLLLILAIAFGVNWRAHEPAGVEAELWSAVPQAAAPRAAAPEPQPQPAPEVKPPPAPPKAEEPPPKPAPDPQIAIEKAKREEEKKKLEAKRLQDEQEQAKREKAKREEQEQAKREEAKRAELDKQRVKEEQDRKKQAADAAKAAAAREAYLKRMQGTLGATGGETSTGTAMRSSGPSASYAGRIVGAILPNIIMTDAIDGDPKAVVEVKVAPDGRIVGRRLLRSSGVSAWDDAVLRAIDKTDKLPRDVDGSVPPVMELSFNPKQVR